MEMWKVKSNYYSDQIFQSFYNTEAFPYLQQYDDVVIRNFNIGVIIYGVWVNVCVWYEVLVIINVKLHSANKSSRPEVFFLKKCILKSFSGKHLCQSLSL